MNCYVIIKRYTVKKQIRKVLKIGTCADNFGWQFISGSFFGTGCSTAVDQEVVGSNPAKCFAFSLLLRSLSQWWVLEQVTRGPTTTYFSITIATSQLHVWLTWDDPLSGAAWGKPNSLRKELAKNPNLILTNVEEHLNCFSNRRLVMRIWLFDLLRWSWFWFR